MIDRRTFLGVAGLAILGVSDGTLAQRTGTMPHIGFLTPGPNPREPAFWGGMRDLGYVDGKTIAVDRRSAEGDLARLPALAAEIVKNRPDVIVAIASACTVAAKEATSTIPIVMVGASDPIAAGLVGNLAHPGGNVTGTSTQTTAAVGKLLELIPQFLPRATRVAALWDPINAISQQLRMGETLIAAARLHLFVRIIEVQTREDLDRAFVALRSPRPDAVLVSADTFFLANAGHLTELALANRLPVFGTGRALTEAGILASYGADGTVVARRSAAYVQKILKGAKAGDLAVEQPTKFEFVINLKTAKALGITIPQSVLAARRRGDPMKRRAFVAGVGVLLATPWAAQAQVPGRVYRIGYLGQGSKASELTDGGALERLLRNLRALGYFEGTNLVVESRFADGRPEVLGTLAAELVRAKPELIAVQSVGLARAVLEHTRTIPVVALGAGELQAEPAVHSLAKPGGNLTGMQVFSPETMGKRLQLLREVVPGLRRVAVLRGAPFEGPGFVLYRDATATAAAKLGIRVRFVQFETINDLNRLFGEMVSQRDEALLVWGNPHLNGYRKEIFDLTIQHHLPTISDVRVYPPELMVYAAKRDDVWREAATYVDRILKGASPGDLPIGQPRTFELIINLKTAKLLGVTIPQPLLLRADEVIQ